MDKDISEEETQKILKAFKDPEFRKLFEEYAKEISDPNVRKQREAEISLMEGKVVTTPEPGLCFKTVEIATKTKVFFNIVHSDKIDPAVATKAEKGSSWKIPYSWVAPREDKDASGALCYVTDIVVNTQTFQLADRDLRFRGLVIQTATEAYEQRMGKKLDREFHVMKNFKYKGEGGPKLLAFSNGELSPEENKKSEEVRSGLNEIAKMAGESEAARSKASAREEAARKPAESDEDQRKKGRAGAPLIEEVVHPEGAVVAPKYKIVHRHTFDLKDHTLAAPTGDAAASSTRPVEISITIHLPKQETIAGVDLEVTDRVLTLLVPGKYDLRLTLPYPVRGDDGKARFDKASRTLTVDIPVVPLSAEEIAAVAATAALVEDVTPQGQGPAREGKQERGQGDAAGERPGRPDGDGEEEDDDEEEKQRRKAKEEEEEKERERQRVERERQAEERREQERARQAKIEENRLAALAREQERLAKRKAEEEAKRAELAAEAAATHAKIARTKGHGTPCAFACRHLTPSMCSDTAAQAIPVDYTFRQEPSLISMVIKCSGASSLTYSFERLAVVIDFSDNLGRRRHLHMALAREIVPDSCHCDVSSHNIVVTLVKERFGDVWANILATTVVATMTEEEKETERVRLAQEHRPVASSSSSASITSATPSATAGTMDAPSTSSSPPVLAPSSSGNHKSTESAPVVLTSSGLYDLD